MRDLTGPVSMSFAGIMMATKKIKQSNSELSRRKTCGLILTYQCNLDCTYCYIPEKTSKKMSLETAQVAIKNAFASLANSPEFNELEIDFCGAEPLCAFDRMKEICEWTWNQQWDAPFILFASTNGTLLNDEMKSWFSENKHRVVLGLSYDGNDAMQDTNRPFVNTTKGSSTRVDLDFFYDTWPSQGIKMTISPETANSLASGCIALHKKGFKIHANPAHGAKWREDNFSEFAQQLNILAEYYSDNPKIEPSSLFDLKLRYFSLPKYDDGKNYCGAGTGMYLIDIDGEKFPCQTLSPLTLNEEQKETLRSFDFSEHERFIDPECSNCILEPMCPTCYGMSFLSTNDPAKRDQAYCDFFIIQVLANCKFQSNRLERIGINNWSDEDKLTAMAISRIQNSVNATQNPKETK